MGRIEPPLQREEPCDPNLPPSCDPDGNALVCNSGELFTVTCPDGVTCKEGFGCEVCGDGVLVLGEACDDGSQCDDGSDCNSDSDCLGIGEPFCLPRSGDGCSSLCQVESVCGNEVLEDGEECDDGNLANNDGCDANCSFTGDALITVQDNGPGISQEAYDKLFEPFFTTKAKGTGLGLAVTRAIVEAHQGQIEAHNLPQGGASFQVLLPRKMS